MLMQCDTSVINGTLEDDHFMYLSNSLNESRPSPTAIQATDVINNIVIPVIFTLGIFGNLVSLAVFCQKNQNTAADHVEHSATVGLITLAASDLLFCLVGFPAVFLGLHGGGQTTLVGFYYTVYRSAFANVFLFTSTWLIVLISAERFIGVCFPFPARSIIRVPRTLTAHALVFVVSLVVNLPLFFKWKIREIPCYNACFCYVREPSWLLRHKHFEKVHIMLWFSFGTFIPLFVLVFCNACILRAIYRGRRATAATNNAHEAQALQRITWTLLSIVFCYLLLVCPSTLLHFFSITKLTKLGMYTQVAVVVTNLMQAIKFSCNFLLYCAIHRRFRQALALRLACLGINIWSPSGISSNRSPKRTLQLVQLENGKAKLTSNPPDMI
ncbi:hypothetical protein CAPTEDRAFT_209818 [Capitella teleta]|uniref:G-protein coupled receptors family 1 profile domain-containing protein n=1 Tax=Capitella teleta TaxID=283909 RepID=R7T412_CAPTE|nr:hypothetical protein CAPTEDRAFT_209818 [Capitella teleta]|eukprot:ELT87612.1 hypothetical protein CAPTEDRAFT_209818 [Capitella teleta]